MITDTDGRNELTLGCDDNVHQQGATKTLLLTPTDSR